LGHVLRLEQWSPWRTGADPELEGDLRPVPAHELADHARVEGPLDELGVLDRLKVRQERDLARHFSGRGPPPADSISRVALHIDATWHAPFSIRRGRPGETLHWMCDELDNIPEDPGIYVFGRRHGVTFEPHYVGQAKQIQKRVLQQLRTNVPLITSLWHAKTGAREIMVCTLRAKRGQQLAKALDLMENTVIRAAIAAGHRLVNKRGTCQPTHEIGFSGNRAGCTISGKLVRVPIRGA
jgi:hypothetical protein